MVHTFFQVLPDLLHPFNYCHILKILTTHNVTEEELAKMISSPTTNSYCLGMTHSYYFPRALLWNEHTNPSSTPTVFVFDLDRSQVSLTNEWQSCVCFTIYIYSLGNACDVIIRARSDCKRRQAIEIMLGVGF